MNNNYLYNHYQIMYSITCLEMTIDNLIKSIDMYNSLIIITDDVNLNLVYIDCVIKLDSQLNKLFKYLKENPEKYPDEYLKYSNKI